MRAYLIAVVFVLGLVFGVFAGNGPQDEHYENGEQYITYEKVASNSYRVTIYYPNGQVRETGFYCHGERHGYWHSYYEDGQPEFEAYYYEGKKIGKWKTYDLEGNELAVIHFPRSM